MGFRATFLVVVAVTLIGQLAALGFEMAAAARFGTGLDADALAFALTVVLALTTEVVGWISTLFVPLYVEARATSASAAAAFPASSASAPRSVRWRRRSVCSRGSSRSRRSSPSPC